MKPRDQIIEQLAVVVGELSRHDRGRRALGLLQAFLAGGAGDMPANDRARLFTLVAAAFSDMPGPVRDLLKPFAQGDTP